MEADNNVNLLRREADAIILCEDSPIETQILHFKNQVKLWTRIFTLSRLEHQLSPETETNVNRLENLLGSVLERNDPKAFDSNGDDFVRIYLRMKPIHFDAEYTDEKYNEKDWVYSDLGSIGLNIDDWCLGNF